MTEPALDVREISLALLDDNPDNPRQGMEAGPLEELENSIRKHGVLQPILVRPLESGRFGIVLGHRRTRASRRAGKETIPARVRAYSDADAINAALAENRVREDVTALEEATSVAKLLADGEPANSVAASLGITVARVRRLGNLSTLATTWREALEASPYSALWTEGLLEMVALVAPAIQEDLLASLDPVTSDPPSRADLRALIADLCRRLDSAPWDLDDPDLAPELVACSGCPNRSDVSGGLFDQLLDTSAPVGAARCRDSSCWSQKGAAYLLSRLEDYRSSFGADHEGDPVLIHDSNQTGGILRSWPGPEVPLGSLDYEEVRGAAAVRATPALVATGKRQGETIRVRVLVSDRVDPGEVGRQRRNAPKPEPGTLQDLEAREAHLANRRGAWVVDHVRDQLARAIEEQETLSGEMAPDANPAEVLRLIAKHGADPLEVQPADQATEGEIADLLALHGVAARMLPRLRRTGFDQLKGKRDLAVELGGIVLGIHRDQLAQDAVEAVPVPQALKALEDRLERAAEAPEAPDEPEA